MTSLDIDAIRYPGEKGAFFVLLLASLLTLAVLVLVLVKAFAAALVVLLFYVGPWLFIGWLVKILAMASIRGHGIRVAEKQYPQIYEYVRQFAARLGLKKAPEVYVIQATLMNAFATKVIGRHYVILYSHLLNLA